MKDYRKDMYVMRRLHPKFAWTVGIVLGLVSGVGCDAFHFMGRSGSTVVQEEDTWSESFDEADTLQNHPAVRSVLSDAQGHITVVFFNRDLVDDGVLAQLSGLEYLRVLDLVETRVTDAGLKHLAGLRNLEILYLKMTEVGDTGMASLAGLHRLHTLYLSRTHVGDEGLKHLANLKNLEMLFLDFTRVTDEGLTHLAGLSKLQVLDLSGTEITDAGLQHFESLHNLRHLYLLHTKVTEQGVRQLQEKLPKTVISHSSDPGNVNPPTKE